MIKYIYKILQTTLFTVLFSACSTEKVEIGDFQINSDNTISALQEIMYSSTTSLSNLKDENRYERFKIVHISDPHISSWTADNFASYPQNLVEAVEFSNNPNVRINALAATGDFVNNIENTTKSEVMQFMESFISFLFTNNTIPSFICTGNHDTNMLTDNVSYYLSKQDLHNILFRKKNYSLQQPTGENYYYSDLENPMGGKIRIIALDNTDQEEFIYSSQQLCCITQKQVDWLINTALKEGITTKHSVIILSHHPFQPFSKNQETYMCSGTHLYDEKMVPDIINAFIKKETLKRSYKTTVRPSQTIDVQADFTNTPGEFICYLGGHAHTIGKFEVPCNDEQGAKQIMLLANTLSPDMQNNTYSYIERKSNSTNSNSFSIYAIDTQEKQIYITYFGAKSSSTPTIESVSYR